MTDVMCDTFPIETSVMHYNTINSWINYSVEYFPRKCKIMLYDIKAFKENNNQVPHCSDNYTNHNTFISEEGQFLGLTLQIDYLTLLSFLSVYLPLSPGIQKKNPVPKKFSVKYI